MTPIAHFEALWARCSLLSGLHAYLAANAAAVMQPEELLRAEWVARVAALDLYIHELVAQRLLEIFEGTRPPTTNYVALRISNGTIDRIRTSTTSGDAARAFDLDIRTQLSTVTYQDPEKIADGIRLFSTVELWNSVALQLGASQATKTSYAKSLKTQLSLIVKRRNKIAHEGDLEPVAPRVPTAMNRADVLVVSQFIEQIVRAIDVVAI